MPQVNLLAVLLCGVSSLVLGAIWYSPLLFAKAWQRGAGVSDGQAKSGKMAPMNAREMLRSFFVRPGTMNAHTW